MKILLFIDSLGSGGAQRQMVELGKGFKEAGNEVSFLTYHPLDFFSEDLDRSGIQLHCIAGSDPLARILKIRKYIRRGKFEVVLSFLDTPNLLNSLAGLPFRKWKILLGERSADTGILKSPKKRIFRLFHLISNNVVSNSQANIDLILRANPFLSRNHCAVIYNSVDFEKWKPRSDWSFFNDGKLKLVVAAGHSPIKNAEGLLMALSLLTPEERERIHVSWYGDEKGFDTLEKTRTLRESLGLEKTVYFYPASPNIREAYMQADFVGIFSFFEGFPNVICEGMATGMPVLAPEVSDLPIILGSEYPLFFNPKDYHSITDTFRRALSMSQEELDSLGKHNLKRSLEYFRKVNICNQYLSLMNAGTL